MSEDTDLNGFQQISGRAWRFLYCLYALDVHNNRYRYLQQSVGDKEIEALLDVCGSSKASPHQSKSASFG